MEPVAPENENVWVLTVVEKEGHQLPLLECSPDPLRIVKGKDRKSRKVRLVANPDNKHTVRLVLRNAPMDFVFGDADEDQSEIALEPGQTEEFCLKARLGLVPRKNPDNRFCNCESPFAMVLKFDHPGLGHAGEGEHTDMHVEC